jgi:nitrogen fixation protein NifU and related proteins
VTSGFDDLFRENILDHYKHPRNQGVLERPDYTFEDANPLCGDRLRMDFRVTDGTIVETRFTGHGCSISLASASMLSEKLEGMKLEDARRLGSADVLEMLGIELGPVRLKCALLALKTMKAGLYGIERWPDEEEAGEPDRS